ncbi:malonate transporter [Cypionkella aquatica]|uniref:Malonate transporter n=1 Tax=Cypionkella aquatica TaxID=1756042 RepID=A0AA37TS48_9RHOB|nr:AEC family transporter [Cypionkella aquatica]GLS86428.1 malonate transporter [Cypionkella aquatica]
MSALLDVILPVFLLIGFGYAAARAKLFSDAAVDGVMRYAQSFALPVLLFRNVANLDLGTAFAAGPLLSFYIGAACSYGFGFCVARFGFRRALPDSVAIGFACAFSNSLLLGVPITERAYGTAALAGNFAIISIHAPLIYTFGIVFMEWARSREAESRSHAELARQVLRGVFTQPLVVGLMCGFAVNLTGVPQPGFLMAATDMMAKSGLPAALFGLGGVLLRYRPEGDKGLIATVCFASLLLHPGIAYCLARFGFDLDINGLRSVTVTSAMAPGVNAYMFANMYGVGKRISATAVLVATGLSLFTSWGWLHILP